MAGLVVLRSAVLCLLALGTLSAPLKNVKDEVNALLQTLASGPTDQTLASLRAVVVPLSADIESRLSRLADVAKLDLAPVEEQLKKTNETVEALEQAVREARENIDSFPESKSHLEHNQETGKLTKTALESELKKLREDGQANLNRIESSIEQADADADILKALLTYLKTLNKNELPDAMAHIQTSLKRVMEGEVRLSQLNQKSLESVEDVVELVISVRDSVSASKSSLQQTYTNITSTLASQQESLEKRIAAAENLIKESKVQLSQLEQQKRQSEATIQHNETSLKQARQTQQHLEADIAEIKEQTEFEKAQLRDLGTTVQSILSLLSMQQN